MQLDKLTQKSQEALQEAQRIANGLSHQEVDGEHLLLAMIGQTDSLIPDLLQRLGVPPAILKPDLERELARRHKVQGISSGDMILRNNLNKTLYAAQTEVGKLKVDYHNTDILPHSLLNHGVSSNITLLQNDNTKTT